MAAPPAPAQPLPGQPLIVAAAVTTAHNPGHSTVVVRTDDGTHHAIEFGPDHAHQPGENPHCHEAHHPHYKHHGHHPHHAKHGIVKHSPSSSHPKGPIDHSQLAFEDVNSAHSVHSLSDHLHHKWAHPEGHKHFNHPDNFGPHVVGVLKGQ